MLPRVCGWCCAAVLLSVGSVFAEDPPLLPLPVPPLLSAGSYILMEAETGRPIIEQNADRRVPAASLTKLMTSYVLADQLSKGVFKEGEYVKISKRAWAQNPTFKGSSLMFIEPSKPVLLSDLHRGLVVSSGNDASVAIAEHIAGSEEAFVQLMNHQGQLLGMHNSTFANAHGLSSDLPAYTTAGDIALLAREYIRRFPEQYRLYSLKSFTYGGIRQRNRNRLLGVLPGLDGIKTGYTQEAGYCLLSSAQRKGLRLIAAVFGSSGDSARFSDSRRLLEYGFRYYELVQPFSSGDIISERRLPGGTVDTLPLAIAEDVQLVLPKGRATLLERIIEVREDLEAPVDEGEEVGLMLLYLGGAVQARVPLQAGQSVPRAPIWARLNQSLRWALRDWWHRQGLYRWLQLD